MNQDCVTSLVFAVLTAGFVALPFWPGAAFFALASIHFSLHAAGKPSCNEGKT